MVKKKKKNQIDFILFQTLDLKLARHCVQIIFIYFLIVAFINQTHLQYVAEYITIK